MLGWLAAGEAMGGGHRGWEVLFHAFIKGPRLPCSVWLPSLFDIVPAHEPIPVAGEWDID